MNDIKLAAIARNVVVLSVTGVGVDPTGPRQR